MRWAERISTVLLVGTIHDGSETIACPVLNLSEFGLMVRIDFATEVGARVAVEMRGMPLAAATVRWVRGTRAGIEFDHPQNLNAVFCLMGDDSFLARAPRYPVALRAVLLIDGRAVAVDIGNISARGVRLAADIALELGQTGQIIVPGREIALSGAIRWVEKGEYGFHFARPLPLGLLQAAPGAG
ncbi:PilZ domain-containing protein [Sphingomonas sp. PB4P5]|uniref:PilZ domain-containing protein n=1 Tax=Parasphingomonas puruogangriensis TaxID=3096155 RepID=UPI002FCAA639